MVATHYDVVIVGAGPAGATAALSILRHAPWLSVALLDRHVFPRDKSCGDGIGPGVRRTLAALDALEVVADAPSPPAVRVGGPGRWEGYTAGPTVRGRDLSGFVLPRETFDARLAWLARERGAALLEGVKFASTTLGAAGRAVRCTRDGRPLDLTAGVLVGADGAYSRVRRALGVAPAPDRFTHIAMRTYAPVRFGGIAAGEPPPLRLDFEEELLPAYGWVFPTAPDRANVGVGIPLARLKKRRLALGALLESYVAGLARRGVKVGDLDRRLSHLLPHSAGMPALVHERAVLIGDAGSMINPLSGEGIAYGMAAGLLLGERLGDAGAGSGPPDGRPLAAFERQFRARFGRHLRSCWLAHRGFRSPVWARTVAKAAALDQRVMEDAAFVMFEEEHLRPGMALRILRAGLRGGGR